MYKVSISLLLLYWDFKYNLFVYIILYLNIFRKMVFALLSLLNYEVGIRMWAGTSCSENPALWLDVRLSLFIDSVTFFTDEHKPSSVLIKM